FDREREVLKLALAAADWLRVLPLEQHMRSAGGTAVLARLDRIMLGEKRIPVIDAADVLLAGVDIDAPYARALAGRHSDERARICPPPACDDDRVSGRLVESAGAGNAARMLAGRIGVAFGDGALVAVIDRKDRNAVLAVDQRGVTQAAGLGIDRDGLAHSRSK